LNRNPNPKLHPERKLTMRTYMPDSPQAIARVLSLAILADGGLDIAKLRMLARYDLPKDLQLDNEEFDRVMLDFCYDLMRCADGDYYSHLLIEREMIATLLQDIRSPSLQLTLLTTMVNIADADDMLAGGEAVLLTEAMLLWQLDLHHVKLPSHESALRRIRTAALATASRPL